MPRHGTLTIIIALLIVMLAGIALSRAAPTELAATRSGCSRDIKSVLSMLVAAVTGKDIVLLRSALASILIGPGAFREYRLCGFPATVPGDRK